MIFFCSAPERCGWLYLWINHAQNNPNTTGMFACYFSCYINKKLHYIAESRGGFDFCLCTLVEFLQASAPCIVFEAMRRVEMPPPTSGAGAWGCGQEQVGLPGWASCVGVGSERLWLSRWHSSLSVCSVPAQAELGCSWERGIAPLESSGVPLIENPICEPFMHCFIRQLWESVVMHSLFHQPCLEVPVTKQTIFWPQSSSFAFTWLLEVSCVWAYRGTEEWSIHNWTSSGSNCLQVFLSSDIQDFSQSGFIADKKMT